MGSLDYGRISSEIAEVGWNRAGRLEFSEAYALAPNTISVSLLIHHHSI